MCKKGVLLLACLTVLTFSCSDQASDLQASTDSGLLSQEENAESGFAGIFGPLLREKSDTITLYLKPPNEVYLEDGKVSLWYLKRLLSCAGRNACREGVESGEASPLRVLVKTEGDLRHQCVSNVLEACASAGIGRISLIHPDVNEGNQLEVPLPLVEAPRGDVIEIRDGPGPPRITLGMVRVKLLWIQSNSLRESKDPKSGRTLLKVKNIQFPSYVNRFGEKLPDFKKLYQYICRARDNFKPTKPFNTVPVVIDARPLVPFWHVLLALKSCNRAGITDVRFARQKYTPEPVMKTTRSVPRATAIDAYGIGGGRAAKYGRVWGKGRLVKKPIIILDEEIEITKDIPKGTSFDNLSNRSLNSSSVIDGPTSYRAGAYGQRWGKGSLVREGGSPGTESAVVAALRWLHFHQSKDGSWDQDGFSKNCDKNKGPACGGRGTGQFDVAVSSLTLLAYLGSGHTHRVGQFKKTVKRGLDWLVKQQQEDGSFGKTDAESWVYNHAIATQALCEAYAVTRDFRLKAPAQKAIDYIRKARNPGLGWGYEAKSGWNDSSVTGWMVMALKAAKTARLSVDKSAFQGAMNWLDRVTNTAGKCGYLKPGDDGSTIKVVNEHFAKLPSMTAVSVLCRIFSGQSRRDPKVTKGVDILMANLPRWNKPKNDKVDIYYWYYATNAMFQYGGKNWHKWNTAMKKALLDTQRVGGCTDGSWDPVGKWGMVGGRVYATAINCLTLETYYRYQRARPSKAATEEKSGK